MAWLVLIVIFLVVYLPFGAYLLGRVEGRRYHSEVEDGLVVWFWPVFLMLMLGSKIFSWCWNKGARQR